MVPTAMILALFFFGIEEIAIQLEEPFSILPLKAMSDGIFTRAQEYTEWYKLEGERALKDKETSFKTNYSMKYD
jgi:predicted membrane chloride channel (bestrophin family)